MKWRFSIFVFSALFAFLFGLFITTGDTYAVNDLVITVDSNTDLSQSSNRYICGGSTNIDCSQWRYAIFSFTGQSFDPGNNLEIRYGTFYTYFYPYYNPYMIQEIVNFSSPPVVYQFNNFSSWLTTGTFTITLTDTLPSDPCPVCPICPEVPDNPYDDKFDEVIQAIYVCSGTILVIYFFYCIYRLIIRNSGVK